ncbi:MAG: hypothetical protein M0Z87_04445 [Actinomycetota bacterium]|nr:hypothetical protein [Actinomycetota bacterium]
MPAVSAAAGGPDGERRAGLVGAQLLGVALCRYVLKLEPIASQDPESLIADLAGRVQRYLTGQLAAGGPRSRTIRTLSPTWDRGRPPGPRPTQSPTCGRYRGC